MAKLYGDIPCVNLCGDIHITVNSKECLCGNSWSYEAPFLDKPGVKRTNIIWRSIEAVSCSKCKCLYLRNNVFCDKSEEKSILCSERECEPPFGGKEDCEFNRSGCCIAAGKPGQGGI